MNRKLIAALLFLLFFERMVFCAEEFLGQNVLRGEEVENGNLARLRKCSTIELERGIEKETFDVSDLRKLTKKERIERLSIFYSFCFPNYFPKLYFIYFQ